MPEVRVGMVQQEDGATDALCSLQEAEFRPPESADPASPP
jgi:hypothetical protein